ncbi:MAG TPA: DNA mismatch repair protein MutS, partial [Anaerolinea sp.]|nr:DNA mismatch repair protein MutS [Anaerolinea sp.]
MSDDVTPIRQQYLDIKRQYPNAILFFRLGDFYETFDADAEITSRELDIVLTSRPVARGVRIPMAGIPYHAVENYLSRLIEKGYHVAICEQVGDQPLKGIFPREVVRVVTPGTLIEPGLLQGDRNNYLAGVSLHDNRAGIAYVDISTGEFAATEMAGEDSLSALRAELIRLNPPEILLPDTLDMPDSLPGHLTRWPAWRFETSRCQEALQAHFQVSSLDGFGLRGLNLAVRSAGAILQYLQETQPAALKLLGGISSYSLSEFMVLDAATRRNLELTETLRDGQVQGSLLSVLDYTVTPMGKRLLRQWVSKPLLNLTTIQQRQQAVGLLVERG